MLTKNEIATLSLSPTKKDFVQIWNELLDVASRLSERWDPTSTNESDPGIVILKAVTGIADKLNYNIDKNTMEAFMPTAAQVDSMRKLCDMLGYNMKYYRSATTEVKIRYRNTAPSEEEAAVMQTHGMLSIPKFTVITNGDQDISYFTTNEFPKYISAESSTLTLPCMEGQIVKCESTNDNNVILPSQISELNRFYLPETQVAENGIFIYNVVSLDGTTLTDGEQWHAVDNLNIQTRRTKAFKFGYDSYESRPYIEFPDDYSELFNEGIFIYFTRTSGANGNISNGTLTKIELPTTDNWSKVSVEGFSVENTFSATNGANAETITQAYNNFKKTVGTFNTLVTCRDYMNKIYSLSVDNKPLVSNILVTDIRNDLNRAITICSCDDAGILYKEKALSAPKVIEAPTETMKPVYSAKDNSWHLGSENGIKLEPAQFITKGQELSDFQSSMAAKATSSVSAKDGFWVITQTAPNTQFSREFMTNLPVMTSVTTTEPAIDHFDLVFYPFKTYSKISSGVRDIRAVYDDSFTYSNSKVDLIEEQLENVDMGELKTLAHVIKLPRSSQDPGADKIGDILSINNYLRLNATVSTNAKVTADEGDVIIDNIKKALANAFNMRELDFGEEIPFDSIIDVIEHADTRIRVVSMTDPELYTTYSVLDSYDDTSSRRPVIREYAVKSDILTSNIANATNRFSYKTTFGNKNEGTFDTRDAKRIYNKLALRNVLAGRIPLYKYDNTFTTDFSESPYQVTEQLYTKEPVNCIKPTEDNPYTMWVSDGCIYTGTYHDAGYVLPSQNVDTATDDQTNNEGGTGTSDATNGNSSTSNNQGANSGVNSPAGDYSGDDNNTNNNNNESGDNSQNNAAGQPSPTPVCTYTKTYIKYPENVINKDTPVDGAKDNMTGRNPDDLSDNSGSDTNGTNAGGDKQQSSDGGAGDLTGDKNNSGELGWNDEASNGTGGGNGTSNGSDSGNGTSNNNNTNDGDNAADSNGSDNDRINGLEPSCSVGEDEPGSGKVSDVELADGEFIKFKAPSFTTTTTYPAYINYNLALKTSVLDTAVPAEAKSLYDILKADQASQSTKNANKTNYQKVLDYFTNLDSNNKTTYKKTFTLTQKVSKLTVAKATESDKCDKSPTEYHVKDAETQTCSHCGVNMCNAVQAGGVSLTFGNESSNLTDDDPYTLLAKSGFVKLTNKNLMANVQWDTSDGDTAPKGACPVQINSGLGSPFITSAADFNRVLETVTDAIDERRNMVDKDDNPVLPTECAWTASFDFECVPFENASLAAWETFIRYCASTSSKDYTNLIGFKPVDENGTIFWRAFGEGYDVGKHVVVSGEKMLKFSKNYFSLLPENQLSGIYLLSNAGKDAKVAIIENNSDYELGDDEYLYIEYTPSETTAGSNAKPVTKVHGPGTVIRPTGFTNKGLQDSDTLSASGISPFKQESFEVTAKGTKTVKTINLFRLGANEQIEIREPSKVDLSNQTFTGSAVYVYKNFNDCPQLEVPMFNTKTGERINNTYILKDGEYIFYTDKTMSEFAYVSSGTEVTLTGNVVIPTFDIIDILTIMEEGPQSIPWARLPIASQSDGVILQENTYVTLGPNDKVNNLFLPESTGGGITGKWQPCDKVTYTVSGDELPTTLPAIKVKGREGNGWEVCSVLAIEPTPKYSQTLRNNGQVATKVTLHKNNGETITIAPAEGDPEISFKTNLAGPQSANTVTLDDIYNKTGLDNGFELKVFAAEPLTCVKTFPGKTIPYFDDMSDEDHNLLIWPSTNVQVAKDLSDIWYSVALGSIQATESFDCALKLPIVLTPKTYGIFSIYVDYKLEDDEHGNQATERTWIELIPGADRNDITIINVDASTVEWELAEEGSNKSDKLLLNPGINCIRVNKPGTIFIKTSSSVGTLYFDDLKLVACDSITFTDTQSAEHTVYTMGLNLEQLGYLPTAEASIIDITAAKNLKDALVNSTCDKIENTLYKISDSVKADLRALAKDKKTVDLCVEAFDAIVKDLENIFLVNDFEYAVSLKMEKLVTAYNMLNDRVAKFTALLEEIEQSQLKENLPKLVALCNSLPDNAYLKQQFEAKLQVFNDEYKTAIDQLDSNRAFYSFVTDRLWSSNALVNNPATLFEEIRNKAASLFRIKCYKQLAEVLLEMQSGIDVEELNELVKILTTLSSVIDYSELTNSVSQLRNKIATEIRALAADIRFMATIKDYNQVSFMLERFRQLATGGDLLTFATELRTFDSEVASGSLTNVADKLDQVLSQNQVSDTTGNWYDAAVLLTDLLDEIESLSDITLRLSTQDSDAEQALLLEDLTYLESDIISFNSKLFTAILSDIDAVQSDITSGDSLNQQLVNTLQIINESKNAQIKKCCNRIKNILNNFYGDGTSEHQGSFTLLDNFTEAGLANFDFNTEAGYAIKEALTYIWLPILQNNAINALTLFNTYITFCTQSTTDSALTERGVYGAVCLENETLKKLTGFTSTVWPDLNEKCVLLGRNSVQNATFIEDVKDHARALLRPTELSCNQEALKALDSYQHIKNYANILAILEQLKDSNKTIEEQDALLNTLESELHIALEISTYALEVLNSVLIPNISALLTSRKTDLNNGLQNTINGIITNICNLTCSNTDALEQLANILSYFDGTPGHLKKCIELRDWLNKLLSISKMSELHLLVNEFENSAVLEQPNANWLYVDEETWTDNCTINSSLDNLFSHNNTYKVIYDTRADIKAEAKNAADIKILADSINAKIDNDLPEEARPILTGLVSALTKLNNEIISIADESQKALQIYKLESQLLADIRAIDVDRDFYYTVPVESSMAIELNNSIKSLSNPVVNYDINNINNNFVISKLDIDYINEGIKIARSSRIN